MAAFNIQEALIWKEKIESVIDQVDFLSVNFSFHKFLLLDFCGVTDTKCMTTFWKVPSIWCLKLGGYLLFVYLLIIFEGDDLFYIMAYTIYYVVLFAWMYIELIMNW